jgi:hypothetical protein
MLLIGKRMVCTMLVRSRPCIDAGVFDASFWTWPAIDKSLAGSRQRGVPFTISRSTANTLTDSVVVMAMVMAVVDFHLWARRSDHDGAINFAIGVLHV